MLLSIAINEVGCLVLIKAEVHVAESSRSAAAAAAAQTGTVAICGLRMQPWNACMALGVLEFSKHSIEYQPQAYE